ncbi:MAG: N-acetylmuramoyl-L-alanine amidase [bacterium]
MKKLSFFPFTVLIIATLVVPTPAKSIEVRYSDDPQVIKLKTIQKEGRMFIPIGDLADALFLAKYWDPQRGKITIKNGDRMAIFTIDSRKVIVEGKEVDMSAPARISDGSAFIPLDFAPMLQNLAGREVELDAESGLILIGKRVITDEVSIVALDASVYTGKTRIRVTTNRPLKYDIVREGDVIIVSIEGGVFDRSIRKLEIDDGLVGEVTPIQEGNLGLVRITLASEELQYTAFELTGPNRIILDVSRPDGGEEGEDSFLSKIAAPPERFRIKTIIIDPGHGGRDPGAIGRYWGTREKDITLDIALRLRDLLAAHPDISVLMTREGDEFVSLSDRAEFANRVRGDSEALFVSIHANSASSRTAQGFETFIYNKYATDAQAEEMAELENAPMTEEEKLLEAKDSILDDIRQQIRLVESLELADAIQTAMADAQLDTYNKGVKQANFFVLKNTDMPSILFEIAFLSNRDEEKRMRDPEFRQSVAEALYRAIVKYKTEKNRQYGFEE